MLPAPARARFALDPAVCGADSLSGDAIVNALGRSRHRVGLLLDALSVLLPDEEERELLRFCLGEPESPRILSGAARSSSEEPRPPLDALRPCAQSLFPLLFARLEEKGISAPRAVRDRLRAAYFLESSRAQQVQRSSECALRLLASD